MPPPGELSHGLCGLARDRIERREVRLSVQERAPGLNPVIEECRLHLGHDRPLNLELGITPVVGILRVARIKVRDPQPAGEPHPAIHHQELPVGPVVETLEVVPSERVVFNDFDAGRSHLLQQCLVQLLRSHPIHQHVGRNAGAGALRQRLREPAPHVSG